MPYQTVEWGGSSVDGFGIRKLYPSYVYSSGKRAFWTMSRNDPTVDIENINRVQWDQQGDGSWLIWNSYNGQIRLEVLSPVNAHWRNVEITAYYRLQETSISDAKNAGFIFQPYVRGGHHSPQSSLLRCDGSAYKGAIIVNQSNPTGGAQSCLRKEINHGAYCPNRYGTGTSSSNYSTSRSAARYWTRSSIFYRWLGVKYVVFSYRTGSGVKAVYQALWVDNGAPRSATRLEDIVKGNTTRWVRIQQGADSGGWGTTSSYFYSKCPNLDENYSGSYRQRNGIITRPGSNRYYRNDASTNMATFRTDFSKYRIAFLSVREIAPSGSVR